jgi:hypothetical protein
MATRALDSNDDWTFGKGIANYKTNDEEIAQNVKTRLRSFKNDWFLDIDANIDWFSILGNKNNEKTIISETIRVVKGTSGVIRVNSVDIASIDSQRGATIYVDYDTINNKNIKTQIGITDGNND